LKIGGSNTFVVFVLTVIIIHSMYLMRNVTIKCVGMYKDNVAV